jgi:hypothetical protein
MVADWLIFDMLYFRYAGRPAKHGNTTKWTLTRVFVFCWPSAKRKYDKVVTLSYFRVFAWRPAEQKYKAQISHHKEMSKLFKKWSV